MANRRTTVSVQIYSDDKAEWESAAEEFDSMSSFVRTAVNQYMANDEGETTTDARAELSPEIEDKIDTILERTDTIQTEVGDVRNETRLIHQEVRESPESKKELAGEIFEILPREADVLTQPIDDSDKPVWSGNHITTGRPEDIAEHFSTQVTDVEEALSMLVDDYHMVKTLEITDEPRYYKDV